MAGYRLGVDLGTTWTAAAVFRDGRVTAASLSQRAQAIPTVVHVAADGTMLVGEAAVRRAVDQPERVAREMKRRVGDSTPMLVGGQPWSAELLQARVLRWVVDHVSAEQGSAPDTIVVTHPANWGQFKRDLLAQAAAQVGLPDVVLQPEPVAAAAWYATGHRLADGDVVAVYDLGGGTFDTAIVRKHGDGFVVLGRPDGIERLGGIDFDAAVLGHVAGQVGDAWGTLDPNDPEALADVAELRARCVEAKEGLSADTVISVPVRLPAVRTTVRLTRDELESMIRGPLAETITALRRTLDSAGLAATDLAAVLLVGGSSRIPLVAQLVAAELGVPVAVDANPKYAIAMGAALLGAEPTAEDVPTFSIAATPPAAAPPPLAAPPMAGAAAGAPPAAPPPTDVPATPAGGGPGRNRTPLLVVGAIVGVAALIGAVLAFTGGGDGGGRGDDGTAAGDTTTSTTTDDGDGGFGPGDGVLRVGLLVPQSGRESFLAPAMEAAATLAVSDLTDAGAAVELVIADSGEPESGSADEALDELIAQGVDLIVGPSELEGGVFDTVIESGLAGCATHDGTIDALFDDGGRWFRTIPNQELQALAIAQAVVNSGATSAGIASPSDEPDFTEAVRAALEDQGIAVDPMVSYEAGAIDAFEVITELNDSGSTTAVLLGDEEVAEVVNAGASAGYLGPFFGADAMEFDETGRRVAESIAGGSILRAVTVEAVPEGDGDVITQRVIDVLAAQGIEDAFPFAAPYIYDCIALAGVAAASAQSDDPEALVQTMIEASKDGENCALVDCLTIANEGGDVDYNGVSGVLDLDEDGEVPAGLFNVQEWDASPQINFLEQLEVSR